MKVIIKTYYYFGFFLAIFFSVLISLWLFIIVVKYIDPSLYNNLRDKVRVFRTEYMRTDQKYRFTELHPIFGNYDVDSLITVRNVETSKNSRNNLLNIIWKESNLRYDLFPDKYISINLNNKNKENIFKSFDMSNSVKQVEELHFLTHEQFFSKSFHFIPKIPNGSLIIFHAGNTGSFFKHIKTINKFLLEGYEVLAFSMWIIDKQPEIPIERSGVIKFRDHSFLKFINEPLRVYFDPVVAGLNYLTKKNDYDNIIAIGFSGGGWVITVLSAFDQRIKLSYPIAGSYPLYLRRFRNWSTWQETYPPLLKIANYLDLYLMATEGKERRQVQVLNKYDGCCYSGVGWTTYASIIKDISMNLEGSGWDIFVDDSHADHKISKDTIKFILNDINKYK